MVKSRPVADWTSLGNISPWCPLQTRHVMCVIPTAVPSPCSSSVLTEAQPRWTKVTISRCSGLRASPPACCLPSLGSLDTELSPRGNGSHAYLGFFIFMGWNTILKSFVDLVFFQASILLFLLREFMHFRHNRFF